MSEGATSIARPPQQASEQAPRQDPEIRQQRGAAATADVQNSADGTGPEEKEILCTLCGLRSCWQ